ncbi:hypothetical protein G4228_015383 [Cervus hanglu yarkandensis]|nr:hypothetical protein G4228_015383 [Cervus hanglu yarkandensis]
MQPEPAKETGRRGPRERANKGSQGAGARVGRAQAEPPKPGWALTLEGLAAMRPAQRHSHLLFGDLLEDVRATASLFPCESAEVGYRMPDSRAWTLPLEPPAQRHDRLLGVLKAAEARGRVRALRLRYARMRVRQGRGLGRRDCRDGSATGQAGHPSSLRLRNSPAPTPIPQAEEISLLIQSQRSARAAIRLELFLPPQLKPTRIPDPLDRQEDSATVPSARRNEERRRAWRASRESRLQPLPSCEVCATPTPTPEEVRSWAQSFDKLMHSPAGRSVFREFLRTEYSEENMLFWLACEELKAEANQHVVDEKARLIYEDYVSILSPKEVSLDSRVREGINKKMQEPSAHTFDDAQLQIYTLMHRDSYPRFLSSPAYRALLLQGASQSSSEA